MNKSSLTKPQRRAIRQAVQLWLSSGRVTCGKLADMDPRVVRNLRRRGLIRRGVWGLWTLTDALASEVEAIQTA